MQHHRKPATLTESKYKLKRLLPGSPCALTHIHNLQWLIASGNPSSCLSTQPGCTRSKHQFCAVRAVCSVQCTHSLTEGRTDSDRHARRTISRFTVCASICLLLSAEAARRVSREPVNSSRSAAPREQINTAVNFADCATLFAHRHFYINQSSVALLCRRQSCYVQHLRHAALRKASAVIRLLKADSLGISTYESRSLRLRMSHKITLWPEHFCGGFLVLFLRGHCAWLVIHTDSRGFVLLFTCVTRCASDQRKTSTPQQVFIGKLATRRRVTWGDVRYSVRDHVTGKSAMYGALSGTKTKSVTAVRTRKSTFGTTAKSFFAYLYVFMQLVLDRSRW